MSLNTGIEYQQRLIKLEILEFGKLARFLFPAIRFPKYSKYSNTEKIHIRNFRVL